ncbi:MAG: phospho-sugar mutase [Candidatus Sumerlaeota bacterium]|nr:phospho-sugar mutase [Candidatus Sumerlaeota bacterium]
MPPIRTIEETYEVFAQWLKIESAKEELLRLIPEDAQKAIRDRFYCDLEFGTGGLRGIMGAGTNRMNEPVVAMATQGLVNYLLKTIKKSKPSAVICYDSRHNSAFFAQVTAEVLAGNGFTAYLFKELRLTPEVSFAVRALKADVGIMITASHNPPEYNGYKAYWSDGGQMIPPHDVGVIKEAQKISSLASVKRLDMKTAKAQGKIKMIGEEMDLKFLSAVAKVSLDPEGNRKNGASVRVVYTPLHGVGGTLAGKALTMWGFTDYHEVASQIAPDPDFPTAKSSNPEDPRAFEEAIKLMEQVKADIAVASDPDADRMGMVARDGSGAIQFMTGNQMAALFTYYLCERLTALKKMPPRPLIVTTVVTTDLMPLICATYGVEIILTLTGFKWIGNQATLCEGSEFRVPSSGSRVPSSESRVSSSGLKARGVKAKGKTFLFGCEESYGYLFGTHARDKDGIGGLCMAAEIARWAKEQGKTIPGILQEIYQRFGVFDESQVSVYMRGETGMEQIRGIMDRLRAQPPKELAGCKVAKVTDFLTVPFKDANGKALRGPKQLPEANVLMFELEGRGKVVARPSGTEPKIKFYFNLRDSHGAPFASAEEAARRREALKQYAENLKKDFLKQSGAQSGA